MSLLDNVPFLRKKDSAEEEARFTSGKQKDRNGVKKPQTYYFGEDRKNARELVAPNGANTKPLKYMVINDAGRDYYYCGLYVEKMCRYPVIASTFADLFDYPGAISSVHVEPLLSESIRRVNKRIDMLDAEQEAAKNNRNRLREISGKIQNAEELARTIDTGDASLYEVYMYFLLRAESYDELMKNVQEFTQLARVHNMELSATYAAHCDAFLSSLPMNRVYKTSYSDRIPGVPIAKKHIFDDDSLSTVYNFIGSDFNYPNGIILGEHMYTGMPFMFDPMDATSHTSYGTAVCGMPGYGKSATIKEVFTRLVDFDYYFASIDYELNGRRGEYAVAAESVGGVSYSIGNLDGDKLNVFEISEQKDTDEITKMEYETLRLNDKIIDLTSILLSIAISSNSTQTSVSAYDAPLVSRMQEIITRTLQRLFARAGIVDGDVNSLYVQYYAEGKFGAGRMKKRLPQMKDFYMELLRCYNENTDKFKEDAFSLLLDKFYTRVKELYYCPECLQEFTREEVESMPVMNGKHYHDAHGQKIIPIVEVRGASAYFDCQSTVNLRDDIPWVNFDISNAPETERPVLVLICQSFINEYFIKRNSMNPKMARKRMFLIDEFHKIRTPQAIEFMASTYRIARKRFVSPWICTQSIADLEKFQEGSDILRLTETMMLFKHQYKDKDAIKRLTFLTESQVDEVLALGGTGAGEKKIQGQMCLLDFSKTRNAFIKVKYLKQSEELIVETDTEKRALMT